MPAYICVGAAGGLFEYLKQNSIEQSQENAKEALAALSGLTNGSVHALILRYYALFAAGASLAEIRRMAQRLKSANSHDVV